MVTTKLNLSMTEPQVRQIYAKQGDTGRVLDITLDQTPEDGTLRILRPDGTEVTSEAVTGGEVSESGETVTFESMTEADVTELTVGIEPVQDLNGYDAPWVGGAGKNLYNASAINTFSSNGVTATVSNGTITLNGTATANAFFSIHNTGYANQQYTYSFNNPVANSGVHVSFRDTNGNYFNDVPANAVNKTTTFTNEPSSILLYVASGTTLSNFVVKPQLELGSTATAYSPYSNICPITGHDEVTVYDDAKLGRLVNFNQLIQNGNFANGTTGWSASGSNTISASGGELSVSIGGTWNNDARQTLNTIADHKYIVLFEAKGDSTVTKVSFGQFGLPTNATIGNVTVSTEYQTFAQMMTVAESATTVRFTFGENGTSYVGKKYYLKSVNLFDLTEMFGDGNEPTIEEFEALFPKDYYPYNTGEETTVSAVNGDPNRQYTTSLGQTVYGGTLDMVSGVLTVDSRYLTVDDFSDYNGGVSGGGLHWVNVPTSFPTGVNDDASTNVCSHAPNGTGWASRTPMYSVNSGGFPARIYVSSASLADFKTEYASLQAVYKLATPVTYQLTPQQIKTLVGTNNVWANSGQIVNIKFSYGGMLSELPSDATEIVGKCYCDVEQNGVSSMPFTLNVKKNERES